MFDDFARRFRPFGSVRGMGLSSPMRLRLLSFLICPVLAVALPACSGSAPAQGGRLAPVAARAAFLPETPPPPVVAESAIVIDAITGRIMAGKNPDRPRAVASTQKLMTALLVVEDGPLDKVVTVAPADTRVEPTKLYLEPGEKHTRRTLLQVILVRSANDAAMALARDVGGSKEGFAALMNQRARSLGMRRSHFVNPHGLTERGQHSTARDLAILARKAYQYYEIRRCFRLPQLRFVHNDGRARTLKNTNKLLKRLPCATGMKTGTTDASGKCLVSSAELDGRVAIAVVLGSTRSAVWSDSEKLLRWALEDSAAGTPSTSN